MKLHHHSIAVAGKSITKSITKAEGIKPDCALGETSWEPFCKLEMLGCRLKIIYAGKAEILVGLAMEHKLSCLSFRGEHWSNPGHGTYLVGSTGSIYSHSDRSVNCTKENIHFSTDDVVEVVFDSKRMRLQISCRRSSVVLKIENPNYTDRYRLVVFLTADRQSVQLLDDSLPPDLKNKGVCSTQ